MPHCHNCGAEVVEGSKFCSNCGTKLLALCPSCNGENPPDSKFCRHCGTQLGQDPAAPKPPPQVVAPPPQPSAPAPLEGERRVVAVIFADVVGSTPMSLVLDPEEFREVMNQCFHLLTKPIAKYDGTVDKFIGDCIMALFGAPKAHENDAERAVLAALEMQEVALALKDRIKIPVKDPLRLRIGINSGMVIAGEVGSDMKRDYTAMGRVVNVAERMQKLCDPGKVTVSDSVFKATRKLFNYEDMGAHPVKGVDHDVRVYRAIAPLAGYKTTRGLQDIGFADYVNREKELRRLREAVEQTATGKATVVAVTGAGGIGKSRLVQECQRITELSGVRWFWARCLEYERHVPYAPIAGLIRPVSYTHLTLPTN